jgi:transposase
MKPLTGQAGRVCHPLHRVEDDARVLGRPLGMVGTQVDAGQRPGVSTAEAAELRRLRTEVKQLRLANDILKTAAFFAAAELDRRLG